MLDKSTKEAKTLSLSLHYLSTQFALILAENTGLRASLQGKKKHKVKGQVLSHLTNNSGSLTLSPATVEKALEALAQKDRDAEEELAKEARSKAARQAAKENKLALQAVAAEKRKADKERREKEREEQAQKIAQRKREREKKPDLPQHHQRRGNRPQSQHQTGPPRSRQSDSQVVVHWVWEVEVWAQKQHRYPHPKSPKVGATSAFQVNLDNTTLSH
jgi:hypothetical protein